MDRETRLNPCPQCGAVAGRLITDYGLHRDAEVIQCSHGCGYPRLHPHVCSAWMDDSGWTDLSAMWNACRIETDPTTGDIYLCWGMGPNYRAKAETAGQFLEWSPAISAKKIAERAAIIEAGT